MITFERFAPYGSAHNVYFTLLQVAGTSSDRLYQSTAPIAGDVKISLDGGATGNTTNLPTHIGAGIWKLILTAAEMSATDVMVTVVDADGPAFRDTFIHLRTRLLLGQLYVDSTNMGSNNPAIYAKGIGTSFGIEAAGATDALIHNLFNQLEGTEPSGAPADNASFKAIWQALKRRFFDQVETTSTTQIQRKDNSTDQCWTRTVADDGTTQQTGKVQ